MKGQTLQDNQHPADMPQDFSDQTIGLKLREARKDAWGQRGSLARCAQLIGVSTALLSLIERGEHPLSKVRSESLERFPEGYGLSPQRFADLTGITLVRATTDTKEQLAGNEFLHPVYALGGRSLGPDDIVAQEYVNSANMTASFVVIEAHDDSMAPRFRQGDWIYINREFPEVIDGKVYLVRAAEGYILRRIQNLNGQLWALAESALFAPQSLERSQIIGRAYFCRPTGHEV